MLNFCCYLFYILLVVEPFATYIDDVKMWRTTELSSRILCWKSCMHPRKAERQSFHCRMKMQISLSCKWIVLQLTILIHIFCTWFSSLLSHGSRSDQKTDALKLVYDFTTVRLDINFCWYSPFLLLYFMFFCIRTHTHIYILSIC